MDPNGTTYGNPMNLDDEEESSDSDIFNEKVTERLDEMNKQEAKKQAALDKLTSPSFNISLPTEQETRATLQESSGDTKTKMIDTTGNSQDAAVTNEFNPGMQNN